MKRTLCIIAIQICYFTSLAQLEISTGYAVNRVEADGLPIHLGYDFKINQKLYTKSQIGYKHLFHYNDFVEATIKFSIFEYHQTLSYEVLKKRKYILKPNVGINYRFYTITAEMKPPYNIIPQRGWIIDRIRGNRIRLNSFDGDGSKIDKRKVSNLGLSIQLQNQFKLNSKLWIQVTPFLEPDYDRTQNTGGCYIGIIFKEL